MPVAEARRLKAIASQTLPSVTNPASGKVADPVVVVVVVRVRSCL